ncbi:hypothetical protein CY35_03G070200 [Sphagnum magellanicum]|nr:hypothetical protein CY35_03G070200 [Sphagnum magellanicum]KAH9568297.1 hypothetical protein CY35_03G070200 [Sphagnum magellanicum]
MQMFGEGSSGAGVGTTGLVPTRFVWPHGGRRVYLCGDFTRWQETLPLSPVEGSSSVFQVICSLSPGYHQYKFIVDGEWRHDEQQAHMVDTNGNVNNWLLVTKQPHHILPPTSDPVTLGATMDVDHDMLHHIGSGAEEHHHHHHHHPQQQQHHLSRALMAESGATIVTAAEAEASKKNIMDFLLHHSAYELLPESGKVVALDVTLPVKQAFHALYEQGIPAAPLWDAAAQQFVGMLTASDFITILQQLESNGAVFPEEELETHTIAEWKEEKQGLVATTRHSLVSVGPDDTLRHVVDELLSRDIAQLPILYYPAHALVPELLHLACLSDVLKCICRHFRHVPASVPLLSQPIGTLRVGTWVPGIAELGSRALRILRGDERLSQALAVLIEARVSALPIVDENGVFQDVYARRDITALARDRTHMLPQLNDLTVNQALQIGAAQDCTGSGSSSSSRYMMCLRSDSLRYVIERLALPGVRRLICIEAGSRQVEGIITLRDIFHFLLA